MRTLLSILFAFSSTVASAQTLVGHWPFNGNADDISGNGLNGTVTNATLTAGELGVPNTAYYFNGTNAHIDVPFDPLLNLTSWSMSAVVKPMGFYSGVCQDNAIIWRGRQTTASSYVLVIYDNAYDGSCSTFSPDHEYLAGSAAGNSPVPPAQWVTGTPIQLGNWYCFTQTYGNDTLKFYIDGFLTVSMYWPNQYNYTPADNIWNLTFGYQQNEGTYPFWFNGVMDEIKLYDGVLPDAQILSYCQEATSVKSGKITVADITLSPNPADNVLNVQIPSISGSETIQLMDLVGRTLSEQKVSSQNMQFDVSSLSPGIYIVRVLNHDHVILKKFIKE